MPPLTHSDNLSQAILARADIHRLEELALEAGMTSRWERAHQAVEDGLTSPGEIRRVLGVSKVRWPRRSWDKIQTP